MGATSTTEDQGQQAQGIDVSHYQGTVDWNAVRGAGMSFAFAKATEGLNTVDAMFSTNWPAMGAAGLLRGAYHFFHPEEDAATQAQHFLSVVGTLSAHDLPPVLDVEETNGVSTSVLWAGVTTWLETVGEETGRTPMLYISPGFWDQHTPNPALEGYPLWLADYAATPTLPTGFGTWNFWQYSQSGTVAGVSGAVDRDVFNGPIVALLAFLAQG